MPLGVSNRLVGHRAHWHRIAIGHTDVAALWVLEKQGSAGGGAGHVYNGLAAVDDEEVRRRTLLA